MGISFEPAEEQRALQQLAHDFAERELRPIAAECDERDEFPPELLGKAAKLDLTSYAIPREHGGGGADAVTAALIAEELGWGCASRCPRSSRERPRSSASSSPRTWPTAG